MPLIGFPMTCGCSLKMTDSPFGSVATPTLRRVLPDALRHPTVLRLLRLSVAEDVHPEGKRNAIDTASQRDVTSAATIAPDRRLEGHIVAKESGILAGMPLVRALFRLVDDELSVTPQVGDGTRVEAGQTVAAVAGPGPALLTAERPALNFLGRLSGVATRTCRFVDAVAHTDVDILDTRKTLPGHRHLDKYAVRQGGGRNHRMGLYDMVLIKDNHIDGAGGVAEVLRRVRKQHGDNHPVEIEVKTLDELDEALAFSPDVILLDNMDRDTLRHAVDWTDGRVPLEASGGVTIDTVAAVAETGVDRISVGALTHSAAALDVSIRAR